MSDANQKCYRFSPCFANFLTRVKNRIYGISSWMFCSFTAVGSKKTDWNKYNSFALSISSHGLEIEKKENGNTVKHHAILMFDDVTFDTKDVLGYFSDKECTGLIDKAKIFFIQV